METIELKESGLQILDKKESELKELVIKYSGLTINGIEDKEGYKAVRDARITLKNERVQVQKDAKELRQSALDFQKKVIEREKELIAIIEPIESSLHEEEKKIEAEKERIKAAKERLEAERIQNRINQLSQFNYASDYIHIKGLTDDQFSELLTTVQDEYNQEQLRLENERLEAERLKKEEEENLRIEKQKATEMWEAVQKERLEQEKARAELKAERDKIEAEKLAIQQEKEREEKYKQEARRQKLWNLGLKWNGSYFIGYSVSVNWTDVLTKSDLDFDKMYDEVSSHISKQKEIEQEKAIKEAAEKARIEADLKAKRDKEEETRRIEEEKQAAIEKELSKPDKDKFQLLITDMESLKSKYSFKSKKYVSLQNSVNELIDKTIDYAKSK